MGVVLKMHEQQERERIARAKAAIDRGGR